MKTRREFLRDSVVAGASLAFWPLPQDPRPVAEVRSGPEANRVNLVFVSEGYREDGMADFRRTVQELTARLLSHPIFREYRSFLNVFRLEVPSRRDWEGTGADTAFGVRAGGEHDLEVDWGSVRRRLGSSLPRRHVLALLVHRAEALRSKGGGHPTTGHLATGSSWPVFLHELGHALGMLGDEYPDGGPLSELSVNVSTSDRDPPWKPLLDRREGGVGLYRVDGMRRTFWRGEARCIMGQDGEEFGPVCRWGMVLGLHRHVRLFESVEPPEGSVDRPAEIRVRLLEPSGHRLRTKFAFRPGAEAVRNLRYEDLESGWRALEPERTPDGLRIAWRETGRHTIVGYAEDPSPWIVADPEGVTRDVRVWVTRS